MCHPEVPAGQATPTVNRIEVSIPVGGGETIPSLLACPEGGPAPAVLVIADIFGRTPFYEHLSARLATAGFEALLPNFFFRLEPLAEPTRELALARRQHLDEAQALEDLRQCLAWLRDRPGYAGVIGTLGFCLGGTIALDLAAIESDLATVCYYGFPAPQSGKSKVHVPGPLNLVDRIRGPILGFWGDRDEGVGMANVEELARLLTARGAKFEHTIYPGLGHGFMAASRLDEETEGYEAACESWTRSIAHYRRHLRAASTA